MDAHTGLFFPYLHFPNDNWVKLSALYWDKIYRIVPYGYETKRDTDLVKALSQINNAPIAIIHPDGYWDVMQEIKIAFMKLITTDGDKLKVYYGVDNRDQWENDPYTMQYSPEANPKLVYIYDEKIEEELWKFLLESKLATKRSGQGDDTRWIGMHPRMVNVYMAALAEGLASRIQSHPITNDSVNYFAVSGFTFKRLAQVLLDKVKLTTPAPASDDEIEATLATIALRAVMPKDISNTPIDKILLLREKYSGEYGKFQDFIHKIIVEFPNLKNIQGQEFVQDHLDAVYQKEIKPKLDELDDAMNSIGIETIPTVLNLEVKVPTLLTGAGLITGAAIVNPVLGATAAVALGLLKIIGDKRKAIESEIKISDVAYLLHVRDDLTPLGSLDWLNVQARNLMFGV